MKKVAVVDEAEPGDDYQSMPTEPKKRSATSPPRIMPQSTNRPPPLPVANTLGHEPTSTMETIAEPASQTGNGVQDTPGMADDDDWLRNRTNRLLDLADEDDIIPIRPRPTTADTTNREDPGPAALEKVDTTGKNTDAVPGENAQEGTDSQDAATLNAIRKTARIFCRNLPYDATAEDLRAHFERFGEVEEVRDSSLFTYAAL